MATERLLLISLAVGPTICIQDLRDIDGDREVGRKTLPLAIGEGRASVVLCACFVALPALTNILLRGPAGLHPVAILFDALVAALCWTIAARVVLLRSRRSDHVTYMLCTGWFCAELCSALFTFRAA
ncbi:UbiA family prenyltransferase [Sorangium sp. So ce1128]